MSDELRVGDMRRLLLALRQAALIVTGAIEEYLGLERSRPPKRCPPCHNSRVRARCSRHGLGAEAVNNLTPPPL